MKETAWCGDLVFVSLSTNDRKIARNICERHYKRFDIWTPLVLNPKHSLASGRLVLPSLHFSFSLYRKARIKSLKYFPAVFHFIKGRSECVAKIMGHRSASQEPFISTAIYTLKRIILLWLTEGDKIVGTCRMCGIWECLQQDRLHVKPSSGWRIILRWILEQYVVRLSSGLNWLRIELCCEW